jgi:TRAP-type mannitol/chloroaromatic compound transport system permease small subunit
LGFLLKISARIDAVNEHVGRAVYWLVLLAVFISSGNAVLAKMQERFHDWLLSS